MKSRVRKPLASIQYSEISDNQNGSRAAFSVGEDTIGKANESQYPKVGEVTLASPVDCKETTDFQTEPVTFVPFALNIVPGRS